MLTHISSLAVAPDSQADSAEIRGWATRVLWELLDQYTMKDINKEDVSRARWR